MKDLKVLWLGRNDETRMTSHMKQLRWELEKRAEVFKYGPRWEDYKGKDVVYPVKKYNPDVVYIGLYHDWENLSTIEKPKFHWWSDPHTRRGKRIEWSNKSKMDVVLHCCYGAKSWGMEYLESLLDAKSVLFPHAVDIEIFKDYKLPKIHDVLIAGRSGRSIYPLRYKIKLALQEPDIAERYTIKWQRRPKADYGWTEDRLKSHDLVSGESFARLMCQSKVFPFGTSIHRYVGNKINEGMATNTLTMFNSPYSQEKYGLVPDVNYVEIGEDNLKEKLRYYINNKYEREKIAKRGYDMVRRYHSTKVRVDHLMKLIEAELERS